MPDDEEAELFILLFVFCHFLMKDFFLKWTPPPPPPAGRDVRSLAQWEAE